VPQGICLEITDRGEMAIRNVLPFRSGVAQSPLPPGRFMSIMADGACRKYKLRDSWKLLNEEKLPMQPTYGKTEGKPQAYVLGVPFCKNINTECLRSALVVVAFLAVLLARLSQFR